MQKQRIVQACFENEATPFTTIDTQFTPLELAIHHGHRKVIRKLTDFMDSGFKSVEDAAAVVTQCVQATLTSVENTMRMLTLAHETKMANKGLVDIVRTLATDTFEHAEEAVAAASDFADKVKRFGEKPT